MSKVHFSRPDVQNPAGPPNGSEADKRELSHRGLLSDESDREGLPEDDGFVREVRVRPRSRIRRPGWTSNRMA